MRVEQKLAQWREAGLIDDAQAERIARFEAARARPVLPLAVATLGALTVGIGLVSLVAANWDGLGRGVKLGADLLLLGATGGALYAVAARARTLSTDALAVLYALLTLASIGLLGQTYQLGSPLWQALLGWALLTGPALALGRGRALAGFWLVQLYVAIGSGSSALLAHVDDAPELGPELARELAAALAVPACFAPLALAHLPPFRAARPAVARVFGEGVWTLAACAGLLLACAFYMPMDHERLRWGSLPFVALLALVGALLSTLYPHASARARGGLLFGLGLVACAGVFGLAVERSALPALVPLLHIALLGAAAFVCLELGSARAFHALTGLVALRVLVAYFEVFGSMLDTGLGMVLGGGLTLLVVAVWRRKSASLARRLGHGRAEGDV